MMLRGQAVVHLHASFARPAAASAALRRTARAAPRRSAPAAARWCRAAGRPWHRTAARPARMRFRSSIASRAGRHRPHVALGDDALHVVFRVGLQPDRGAVREQQVEGGRVRHDAAGRGDHRFGVDLDRLFERAALVAAVGVLAVQRLDLADRCSRRTSRSRGSARRTGSPGPRPACWPERRLAGAAQADQRDARAALRALPWSPPVPSSSPSATRARRSVGLVALLEQFADQQPFGRRRGDVAEQFGQRALQRLRHLQQDQDRGVADAVFQVGEMALGHVGGDASALRVMPRRARSARTRSPSATRNGCLSPSARQRRRGSALTGCS